MRVLLSSILFSLYFHELAIIFYYYYYSDGKLWLLMISNGMSILDALLNYNHPKFYYKITFSHTKCKLFKN